MVDKESLILNETDLQEYLLQHYVNYIPNPSDESDFEDTTYEADLEYEKRKKERKLREELLKEETNTLREAKATEYFNKHKNEKDAIFNCTGIEFKRYTHKRISFEFSPSSISRRYICDHRKYRISLRYSSTKKFWTLKRYYVPNRRDILKIFSDKTVVDNNLIDTLFEVYDTIIEGVLALIATRKTKYQKYLMDEEVVLDSDEELLFLTEEERNIRRRKVSEIWKRMLPPG